MNNTSLFLQVRQFRVDLTELCLPEKANWPFHIEPLFGLFFGLLSGCGLMAVYAFRLSPTDAYQPQVKPRLRSHELIASAMRGTSVALAGIIAALITHGGSNAFGFGLYLAL